MNTKQILFTIAIIAAIGPATVVAPVMAQNMTGGNMTGGNMTGGNMTGKTSGFTDDIAMQEDVKCTPPEVISYEGTFEGKCVIPQGSGSADRAAATAADDNDDGDTDTGNDGGQDGGEDQSEDEDGGQGEDEEEQQSGGN